MSSDRSVGWQTEPAIHATGLSKCYSLFDHPADRLKQMLSRGRRKYYREFWALRDVTLDVMPGEVLGIVGRNGAGKSTLLQLICGTLTPTGGTITRKGRVSALLELGSGFNPDFTGRENIYMAAAIAGLTHAETEARVDAIIEFSGIPDFIDQPVKTYSSGMYVRLAFAVATSVEPEILIVDEALSVGDGAFARKSFDRIMELKQRGATILFCSHSTYSIEAICDRAIWLRDGRIEMMGAPSPVVSAYNGFLDAANLTPIHETSSAVSPAPTLSGTGTARIAGITAHAGGAKGRELALRSGVDDLMVEMEFTSDTALPCPSMGVFIINAATGQTVCSAGSANDAVPLQRDASGSGRVTLTWAKLPLLKGTYTLIGYLVCENGIHVYDQAEHFATLTVSQRGLEQGVVSLPHHWGVD